MHCHRKKLSEQNIDSTGTKNNLVNSKSLLVINYISYNKLLLVINYLLVHSTS